MPSTAFEWTRLEVRSLRHSAAFEDEMAKTKEEKAWEQAFRRRVLAEDGLVDRLGAAEMMGVTDRTLPRWHREGKGPPRIYRGRSVYYRIAEIEAWLLAPPAPPNGSPANVPGHVLGHDSSVGPALMGEG